ncbi:MAG: hypothetical protein IPG08_17110 [Sphingobacteriaceae bacterium]|nr:hypothetical protein [Sphingobacteriaceae bacterium]
MAEISEKQKELPRVILFVAILIVLLFIRFSVFGKEKDFDKIMKYTATELNKTCPQQIDNDTRLDSASIHENKTFRYNYTCLNFNKDSMDVEMFAMSVKPAMINNAKSNPDLQLFRDNNVILEYYFRDELGKFMTRVEIVPAEYLN